MGHPFVTASRQGTLSTYRLHALLLPMREPIGDASVQLVSVVVTQSLVDDLGDGIPRRTRRALEERLGRIPCLDTKKSSLARPLRRAADRPTYDSYGMVAVQTTTRTALLC